VNRPGRQQTLLPKVQGTRGRAARHTLCVGLAALVTACGESVSGPPASQARITMDGPKPDVVEMQRTTDIAAHDGVAAVHRSYAQTLTPRLRMSDRNEIDASANQKPQLDRANLALPSTSLPARFERAMCSSLPSWTRTMPQTVAGSVVEMSGVGDAPASTLRVLQNGRVITTIERTWVRTSHSWELERQVTASSDGRLRDVITYRRTTPSGHLASNAIPSAACIAPSAMSVKTASPVAASLTYYAPTGITEDIYDGSYCDYGSGDPCFDKRNDVYKADAALVILATAMTYACTVPEPLVVPACVAAVAAYGAGVVNLQFAQRSLNNCLAEQRSKCTCSGGAAYSRNVPVPGIGASTSWLPPRALSLNAPKGANPLYDDCSGGYDGSGGGGGGGSGGGGGESCSYQVWEISYDGGQTWDYYGTFWTCVSET
jgi:hypothetical protein